ncbi:MAG: hypothetical protein HYS52_00360 [Candidatus Wildermuthbacteria bacterium]|nr:hypothetical protein [Candidatus Wildermuthbacteria bacterium]
MSWLIFGLSLGGTFILAIVIGIVIWAFLLRKAGGAVRFDANSWLMRKWASKISDRDPRNLCEAFLVVFGAGKIGGGLTWLSEKIEELSYSRHTLVRGIPLAIVLGAAAIAILVPILAVLAWITALGGPSLLPNYSRSEALWLASIATGARS